ncbi:hypothetical protein SAMN05444374_111169 [Rhodococcoides kroppenstedtii]|uniref:Uncharacterized protein n=1 Tax=Rhodococcoides kroppenstedtii TaxID=293050 RepID=A0A1I0U0K7_9NOCA|nr:hypothetical protein SAMN05444374_111169 [Rhodococcus kroppenstedtii]
MDITSLESLAKFLGAVSDIFGGAGTFLGGLDFFS